MKKNELLHVHSLLVAIARQYDERGKLADDALDSYRALGVTPMSIRAPRDDHEDAVLELVRVLGGVADETVGETSDTEIPESEQIPAGSSSE
jgi:hypothetical protein